MAIALDTSAVSTDQTASPLTWTHTCTGSNLVLVVGVSLTSQVSQPSATAVTYAGVAMTQVGSSNQRGAATSFIETSMWVLFAPPQGANTVSVTASLGTTPHLGGASVSYTGARQKGGADANSSATGTATGDQTLTVATVVDNCWIAAFGMNTAASGPTIAADQTSRQTLTFASTIPALFRLEDTNAAKTPPGAQTVGFTMGATLTEDGWLINAVSLAPAPEATLLNNYQFIKADSGISVSERIR